MTCYRCYGIGFGSVNGKCEQCWGSGSICEHCNEPYESCCCDDEDLYDDDDLIDWDLDDEQPEDDCG